MYDFPDDWCVTHSENHWSNEVTMIQYIQGIIVPYVEGVRQMLGKNEQAALAIFDNFRGQLTENVVEELEHHNIQSVLVPANCTDRLQPMDLSVNKSAKAFMRSQFTMWYAEEMLLLHQGAKSNNQQQQPCQQTEDDDRNDEVEYSETDEDEQTEWEDTTETDEDLQATTITHTTKHRKRTNEKHAISESEFEIVDMSTARMKSLGGKWLVKMFEYVQGHPAILINGFKAAGIMEALGINGPIDSSTLDHYDSFTESEDLDDLCNDLDCSSSNKDILSVDSVFQDSDSEEAEQYSPIIISD